MDLFFRALGLNTKEKQLFLKLLSIGACSVSDLSKKTKIERSSLYSILERLKTLGVITQFKRKGILHAKAVDLMELKEIVEEKKKRLNRALENFSQNLEELQKLESNGNNFAPSIVFYEGEKGILKAYGHAANENKFYAYFNPKVIDARFPKFWQLIVKNIQKKNNQVAKELLVDSEYVEKYKKVLFSPGHEVKYLPKGVDFSTDTVICENQIIVFSYGEGEDLYAIQIKSSTIAQSQKKIFELLWKLI